MAPKSAHHTTAVVEPRERFVVLVRHGIAQKRDGKKADEARSLTATGHQRMKVIGKNLARLFPQPDVIYTSPLLRSVQTAEWICKGYGAGIRMDISAALAPDAEPETAAVLLASSEAGRILCVGHEPSLSALLLHLTGMQADGQIELKKGGCYGLRMLENKTARLEWMLPPSILREI